MTNSVSAQAIVRAIGATSTHQRREIEARIPIWRTYCTEAGIKDAFDFTIYLGQCALESDRYRTTSEYWGPTPSQLRYEGRADLGNTQKGDGSRYRGHGDIQYTGRANHRQARADITTIVGDATDVPDFEARPELMMGTPWACLGSLGYWRRRDIARKARAAGDAVRVATKLVNGGVNHLKERRFLTDNIGIAMAGYVSPVRYQEARSLVPDGVIGPRTRAMLWDDLKGRSLNLVGSEPDVFIPTPRASTLPGVFVSEPEPEPAPAPAPASFMERVTKLLRQL